MLSDATATGTIENHDPMPAALIARFGRAAAVHIVDQVDERVNAPRTAGFDGRVAGRRVNRNMGREFALDFLRRLGASPGTDRKPERATASRWPSEQSPRRPLTRGRETRAARTAR